jgi:2'-5' RNA ligase
MTLLRAFIAIQIPADIQDAIQEQTSDLRRALGASLIRWVPIQNIHLTLKFLGDTSPANIELLTQMLAQEADQYPPFDIRVSGIGSFPTSRRPRVIWVGLQAPAVLASLQHGIESASARLGYAPEDRAFSPHLTIGRVKQNVSQAEMLKIRSALEGAKVGDLGSARIDSVHLYKSDLQPGGSVYTRLFSARLNGVAANQSVKTA